MTGPLDRIEAAAKRFPPNGAGAFMADDVLALVAVARAAEETLQVMQDERWDILVANGALYIEVLREALSRLGGAAGNEAA